MSVAEGTVGNTLGGVVAGGLLGATIGFLAGWFLDLGQSNRFATAALLAVLLFGNGVTAGAIVGGVEDILRGMRRQRDGAPSAG